MPVLALILLFHASQRLPAPPVAPLKKNPSDPLNNESFQQTAVL